MNELSKAIKHLQQAIKLIDQAEEKIHEKNHQSVALEHLERISLDLAAQVDKVQKWDNAIEYGWIDATPYFAQEQ